MAINGIKFHTCELYRHLGEVENSDLLRALVLLQFHPLRQWNVMIFEVRKEMF